MNSVEWQRENRERYNNYMNEWNKNHRDSCNIYARKYRTSPKGRFQNMLYQRKRRINKKSVIHNFTYEEWKSKIDSTNGICPRCKRPYEEGYGVTLDHIFPLIKAKEGYIYNIDDVQPLCKSCNCSKKDGD